MRQNGFNHANRAAAKGLETLDMELKLPCFLSGLQHNFLKASEDISVHLDRTRKRIFSINTGKQQESLFSVKMTTAIKSQSQTISYILNIYLQGSFIMFKVLGKLKTLVIKGEDCLKEGQHLKKSQHKNIYNILMWTDRQWRKNFKTAVPPPEHTQLCDRYYFTMTKRIQDNSERDSRAQHIQISSSLGSPAVCTHNPATPPGSASSSFPLGRRPLKTKKDVPGWFQEQIRLSDTLIILYSENDSHSLPSTQGCTTHF